MWSDTSLKRKMALWETRSMEPGELGSGEVGGGDVWKIHSKEARIEREAWQSTRSAGWASQQGEIWEPWSRVGISGYRGGDSGRVPQRPQRSYAI